MPIANCVVSLDCQSVQQDLVALWADESGKNPEHMTINVISGSKQFGSHYAVMASLILPSIWSESDRSVLQMTLAKTLAKGFSVQLSQVHVVTLIVQSGMVVENGQEITW